MPTTTEALPTLFATDLGWIGVAWHLNGEDGSPTAELFSISRLTFGHRTRRDLLDHWQLNLRSTPKPSGAQQTIVERISEYAAGKPSDLSDIPIAVSDRTPFQQSILRACQSLPWGTTVSYAGLARLADRPNSARAVGNVMATNRTPLIVPCHRVVASSGLGGFTAPGGLDTKRRLLELESAP